MSHGSPPSQPMSRRTARSPTLRKAFQKYAKVAYHEAILEAAERVFLRDGYHEAKMADIASEAGVSVGTLYNYFTSKELVFASILERGKAELAEAVAQAADIQDPMQRLDATVRAGLAFVEARGAMFALYTELGLMTETDIKRVGGPHAEQAYLAHVATLAQIIEQAQGAGKIRSNVEASVLASALAGIANACVFNWLHAGRKQSLVACAQQIFSIFLEGAQPR